jgi:hypothetical protein
MLVPTPSHDPGNAFALEVLQRLPLAESFYALWAYLASDEVLAALFEQHRGRCYQGRLAFAQLVEVLANALTRYHGSGRRAIAHALQRQQLPTRARAVYAKLARLPLPLAEAFLAGLSARLRPLFPPGLYRSELPKSLAGLAVVVLDGKKVKRAAKRLVAVRGRPGKVFGGKLLVAYLPADGLAVALAADPDGEANDIRLVPRLLPLARAAVAGPRLWVADRQFCDLDQPGRFAQDGDHFLIRFSNKTSFTADPRRPAGAGADGAGRPFTEEWGWMGAAADPRRRYVRRIRLPRPGAEAVVLVTDLLDPARQASADLLAAYLLRWQIEQVFQASLCLVIDNALQLIRAYVAQAQAPRWRIEELSAEAIFEDLREQLVSLHTLLGAAEVGACLPGAAEVGATRARLGTLLGRCWSQRWPKARDKRPRPGRPKARQSGAHTSVHKILQQAKQARAKPPPRQRE